MTERVQITGIASGGAGVGRLQDGRAVFVHRTAVGDLATVQLLEEKQRYVRGKLVRVEQPGPGRRVAPCVHYERCGGCTLEHLDYKTQLTAKARLVTDALSRIGKLNVPTPEIMPSPTEFRYRNRVSFTLQRLARGVVAGFHELDHPGRIVDITGACLLPEPVLAEAWQDLRRGWGENARLLPAGPTLRLTLRASAVGEVSLVVEGGYNRGKPEELLRAVPSIASVWQQLRPGQPLKLLGGKEAIAELWQDEEIELSGSVFLQVNRRAATLLEDYVLERAGRVAGKTIVDAYCGVGLHARRLARAGGRVTGIELDSLAVREARAAAGANATFICGRTEDELPQLLPVDLVILNPPRAGIEGIAVDALSARPAKRIIYISCNPATLARDLARLTPTYSLHSLRCFDLFPQTAHVETVTELRCATA